MSPRTPEQFREMRDQSREKILQSALDLFATQGYHATSIEQLAKQAEVSKGLIYNYFHSKETILEELIRIGFEKIDRIPAETDEISDPSERLCRQFDLYGELLSGQEAYWQLYTQLMVQPTVLETVRQRFMAFFNAQLEQMETLLEEIGLKNPALEVRILAAILDGIGFHYFIDEAYPLVEVLNYLKIKYCGEN
ncbi:MAG: TetR/AcrR family transcriptional regulator [FCB group bacterium]|nr:TetR/AcrR family transcriptional regulator [FCB group bacterium]